MDGAPKVAFALEGDQLVEIELVADPEVLAMLDVGVDVPPGT